jgi:hypothetical protein
LLEDQPTFACVSPFGLAVKWFGRSDTKPAEEADVTGWTLLKLLAPAVPAKLASAAVATNPIASLLLIDLPIMTPELDWCRPGAPFATGRPGPLFNGAS